jgi:hypothetical protein
MFKNLIFLVAVAFSTASFALPGIPFAAASSNQALTGRENSFAASWSSTQTASGTPLTDPYLRMCGDNTASTMSVYEVTNAAYTSECERLIDLLAGERTFFTASSWPTDPDHMPGGDLVWALLTNTINSTVQDDPTNGCGFAVRPLPGFDQFNSFLNMGAYDIQALMSAAIAQIADTNGRLSAQGNTTGWCTNPDQGKASNMRWVICRTQCDTTGCWCAF